MLVGMIIGPGPLFFFPLPFLCLLRVIIPLWLPIGVAVFLSISSIYLYGFKSKCVAYILTGIVFGILTDIACYCVAAHTIEKMPPAYTTEESVIRAVAFFLIMDTLMACVFIIVALWSGVSMFKDYRAIKYDRKKEV